MAASALALADEWLARYAPQSDAAPASPEESSLLGEAGKGWNRGYENFVAGSAQGLGTAADALGYPAQARGLRAWAQGHRQAAAAPELAPESPTWDSAQGFDPSARFIASRGAEAGPGLAVALATGAITHRPYLGGVAAFTPSNVGDIDQRMREAGTVDNQRALVGGALTSGVQMAPVAGLLGKGLRPTTLLGTAADVGAHAAGMGASMGSGELVAQQATDPNAPFDPSRVRDVGIGGAAFGGAVRAAGAPFRYAGAKLQQGADVAAPFVQRAGKQGIGKVKEAWANRPQSLEEAGTIAGETVAGLQNKAENLAMRWLNKDPDIDVLLKPIDGLSPNDMRVADAQKHVAVNNLMSKASEMPDYVQKALEKYKIGRPGPFAWEPVAKVVKDWKQTNISVGAFTEFAKETGLDAGQKAAELVNKIKAGVDAGVDSYKGVRNNAMTPRMGQEIEASRDDFSPILEEHLAPFTGLKSSDALDNTLPTFAYGMRRWIANGFGMRTGGEPVVPKSLLRMYPTDPVAAVKGAADLMIKQGEAPEEIQPKLDTVLQRIAMMQKARNDAGILIAENLTPTALRGTTPLDYDNLASRLQEDQRAGRINDAEAAQLFGPRKNDVLATLKELDRTSETGPNGREAPVVARVDENGDVAEAPALHPNTVYESVQYHHYNEKGGDPYKLGGVIHNKDVADRETGELRPAPDTVLDKKAANHMGDLRARNNSKVSKLGYVDYLREKHTRDMSTGNDTKGFADEFDAMVQKKKDEILALANKTGRQVTMADGTKQVVHDTPEQILNRHWYVIKEEKQGAKGEATNVDPKEFDKIDKKSRWGERSDGEYGTTARGRIWLEKVNEDGTTTPFATSTSRIVKNIGEMRKREGNAEDTNGIAGQHDMLHQGLSSMLNARHENGKYALSGRIGFKEKASDKEPVWDAVRTTKASNPDVAKKGKLYTRPIDVPDSLRMHSSTGLTYKDAKQAIVDRQNQSLVDAAQDRLRKLAGLDRPLKNDEKTFKADTTKAIAANDMTALAESMRSWDVKNDALKYQREDIPQVGGSTLETRSVPRTRTEKFESKKLALENANVGEHPVKRGSVWMLESSGTERVHTGLPTEIETMDKSSNIRSLEEDTKGDANEPRKFDENGEPTRNDSRGKPYAPETAQAKELRSTQTAFVLSALEKGVPHALAAIRKLAPERAAALVEHLQAMLEAKSRSAPIWGGKPPADMVRFTMRANNTLVELGSMKGAVKGPLPKAAKPAPAKPEAAKVVNIWHGSGENASLSNLAARPFTFNDRQYVSVEHAYQSNKSGKFDQATFDKYRSAGRKIPGTLGTKTEGGWNLKLMKRLVTESFKQNPEALAKLAATGTATLTHTQDHGVWAKEFPRILTEVRSELAAKPTGVDRRQIADPTAGVSVKEHASPGYRERTKHNADSAGVTVAMAHDFFTAGEKLTKNVAGSKWLGIGLGVDPTTAGTRIAKAMRAKDTSTLNVAGNGIYTLKNYDLDQATVNQHVYEALKTAHELKPIDKIVTGGQTGVDLAGAIAAKKLGIPVEVTMPKNFVQRDVTGRDAAHTAADVQKQIEDGAAALKDSDQGAKYNAMSTRIHEELGREGFAATHDSPYRHEGKFDWRSHQGKGEGNAAFGAGTYLSTAEGVHKSYKSQFTAQVSLDARGRLKDDPEYAALRNGLNALYKKGIVPADAISAITSKMFAMEDALPKGPPPTYEVSVGIRPEQLLNWDAPLSEQSTLVQKAMKQARVPESFDEDGFMKLSGSDAYSQLTKRLGSQAKASDYLQSLGILGHKYAAAGGKNDAHPNYVIYDDAKITTNYVYFNKQDPVYKAFGKLPSEAASAADVAKFHEDIARRLGPGMKSVVEEELWGKAAGPKSRDIPLSGKWTEGLIQASAYARNLSQIGAHESFHEFFSRMREQPQAAEVLRILDRAANSEYVGRQLTRLLDGEINALKQIKQGAKDFAEERMAYMFQFHQAGLLKVGPETETVFAKIARVFRRVAGLMNEDEKADMLLRSFDKGEMQTPDAAAKVLANSVTARAKMYSAVNTAMKPAIEVLSRTANSAETNLERPGVKEYHDIRRLFKRSVGENGSQGFLDAKDHMLKQWSNKALASFQDANGKDYSPKDLELAAEYLHTGKNPTDPVVKDIVAKLTGPNGLFPAMHKYLREAGVSRWEDDANGGKGSWVPMGKIEKGYFPRVLNAPLMMKEDFVGDLSKYNADELNKIAAEQNGLMAKSLGKDFTPVTAEDVAKTIMNRLINTFGSDIPDNINSSKAALKEHETSVGFTPMMNAVNQRSLHWLHPEILKKYGEKDIASIVTSYVAQGVKRAEYVRRFGNDGNVLRDKLKAAYNANVAKLEASGMTKDEATAKALKTAKSAATDVMALEGTLGYGINPKLRKFENSMLVYQNMRVLSTSLFSQFIDPLGLVVRGGTMGDAWRAYKRGMAEVVASIKGDPIKDLDAKISDQVGTTDANGFLAAFGQLYSSQYMGKGFRKANDVLFHYNGMEGFNRGMQVAGTRTAINFIKRHSLTPNARSEAYLKELNLKPEDIKIDKDGELDYTDPKIQQAIHQWVNGAIMRPNAAQRPAWASDPHYMMFWHMKQFAYTFHDVILKRAMHEYKQFGDMGPAGILALGYTPIMVASDAMKGLLLSGGQEPGWMRAGLGSEIGHGVMRAGLAGKFEPGLDVLGPNRSILGLGGPAVEQLSQMFGQSPTELGVNALPGANVLNTILDRGTGKPMLEMQGDD